MNSETIHGFFKQVVSEAIRDLRKSGSAYCFSKEQVDLVCKQFPDVTVKEEDGIYYLRIRGVKNE